MADDGSAQSTAVWPLPKFMFRVRWGTNVPSFQEVSGLDTDAHTIEYRKGGQTFALTKLPDLRKYGNVTMRRGIFTGDNALWSWFADLKMDPVRRVPVTIILLDDAGAPVMEWTLHNAWPSKISCTPLKADGNEVAIASIEVVHEGLTISDARHPDA